MSKEKPICSLSLDLDNQWSYMKTHGDPGWDSFPSYLDLVVPRFLKILEEFDWRITVFVVGQDAALQKNLDTLQTIACAGHEISNHSFNHEPWLHRYSRDQVQDEISRAEEAIESATGHRPRGFRGPGYSLSQNVLEVLAERGYLYDASTLPTFIGPLARAYYFMTTNLSDDERRERKRLFGSFGEGLQPVKPYMWALDDRALLEIPVSTLPILRIPFHFSYLLYISTYSPTLAKLYFLTSLELCHRARVRPSVLLHPLDFLGREDAPRLGFFPSMNLESRFKLDLVKSFLASLGKRYRVVTMREHWENLSGRDLPRRRPPRRLVGISNNQDSV